MKKFELSNTETAMRSGSVAPTAGGITGDVCLQAVRRRRSLGGMTDLATGNATPGLPPSAPPIT